MPRPLISIAALAALVIAPVVRADSAGSGDSSSPVTDVDDLSLDELLNTAVTVATRKAVSARETPAVVTVVTREEIIGSGARDLIDVLELVPGFFFGVDVEGAVGVGMRGNWGNEGKVALLVDGQELNELLYATLQLGHELPVDHIERIEIIRGPGSAIYGGFAELAVINVVTRGAKLNGAWVGGRMGVMPRALGSRDVGFQLGKTFGGEDDLAVTIGGHLGASPRSDRDYADFYGGSYSLADQSELGATWFNVGATWQGVQVRYLYDDYRLTSRDGFDVVLPEVERMNFRSHHLELKYSRELAQGLTITPRLQLRRQTPWESLDKSSDLFYRKTAQRLTGGVNVSWDAAEGLNVIAGVEGYLDSAWLDDPEEVGSQSLFNGTDLSVGYQNVTGYAQVLWLNPIVNVTVGARSELHSAYGPSFVPRFGLTRVFGPLHLKALYSRGFRSPSIENISIGRDIRPELTGVAEAEIGYRIGENVFAAVNVFDITIQSPIVYGYDAETDEELYLNYDRTGTRGAELDLRFRYVWGYLNLGYSFYSAAGKNEVEPYAVIDRPGLLLGAPAHKATFNAGIQLGRDWTLNPSGSVISSRFAYTAVDADENLVQGELAPSVLLHLFVTRKNLLGEGVDFSAGVRNILDARRDFAQPYDGGHAPLPGASREFLVSISAQTDFVNRSP